MKPSLHRTGLAFLLLGVGLAAWGFVGLLPSPTFIGGGVAVALTGVGLFFRLRLAHQAGLALSTLASGFGGWNLWRAWEAASHVGIAKAGVLTAVSVYLLISLVWVRAHFRPATRG